MLLGAGEEIGRVNGKAASLCTRKPEGKLISRSRTIHIPGPVLSLENGTESLADCIAPHR